MTNEEIWVYHTAPDGSHGNWQDHGAKKHPQQVVTKYIIYTEHESLIHDLERYMDIASGYINGSEFQAIEQENFKLKESAKSNPPEVDVESLRKDEGLGGSGTEEAVGWNDCIDHLLKTGIIKGAGK